VNIYSYDWAAIYANVGALTITGGGTLSTETYGGPYGITALGNITITGNTTVNARGYYESIISDIGGEEEEVPGTITINAGSTLNLISDYYEPTYFGTIVGTGTLKYNGKSLEDSANELAAYIAQYDGGTGSLTAVADGTTVTVTGEVTDAADYLELDILKGIKVVWQAELTSASGYAPSSLVYLDGGGVFEVAAGGLISVLGNTNVSAIMTDEGSGTTVNITGGEVSASGVGNKASIADSCTLNVSGGTITASGTGSRAILAYYSTVNITGGTISATGTDSYAIYADIEDEAIINRSGGTVTGDVYDGINHDDHTPPTVTDVTYWVWAWDSVDEEYYNYSLPLDGATDIDFEEYFYIHFSEDMRRFGDYGTVTLNPGNITLNGNWTDGNDLYVSWHYDMAPNTNYTLTVSGFMDINGNVMNGSHSVSFKTKSAYLTGNIYVNGTPAYGQTVSADVYGLRTEPSGYPFGALTYEWYSSKDDYTTPVGTGSSYTVQASDIGYEIDVLVKAANLPGHYRWAGYDETVQKAPSNDLGVAGTEIFVTPTASGTKTFDLSEIALSPAYGETGGAVSYAYYNAGQDGNVLTTTPSINGNTLYYNLTGTADVDDSAYILIEITTANFEPVAAEITITVTDKPVVPITGISFPSKTYDGAPIVPIGTPEAEGAEYDLYWNYSGTAADGGNFGGIDPPTKAGTYNLYIFTNNSDEVVGSIDIPFTIAKAPLTVKADNKSATVGGADPTLTYTVIGLAETDDEDEVVDLEDIYLIYSSDLDVAGTFPISIIADYNPLKLGSNGKGWNYTLIFEAGTLTVSAPGGGGGGGGGGGTEPEEKTSPAADGEVSVSITQSGSTATLILDAAKVTEIIGKSDDTATLDLSEVGGVTEATLPTTALDAFADAGLDVEIKFPQGTVSLSSGAAGSVADQANGAAVTVSIKPVSKATLTAAQQAALGENDLVFDISILSGATKITNFDGTITITLPYSGPLPVAVWYMNAAGELEKLESVYDPVTKTVTFTTNHLSLYVLGFDDAWQNPFTDVKAADWFYGDVEYAVVNGLFNGTSATTFSPNAPMTRAMLITVLARLDGVDTDGGETWYEKAVAWGVENEITDGTNPNGNVTREQLATMIVRYSELSGKTFPVKLTYAEFADDAKISDYAKNAVQTLFCGGIVNGKPENRFDPQGNATRAEVAAILHRFLEAAK
jgi:hypothetical protein